MKAVKKMRTHAVGRHLIDLPTEAHVSKRFKFSGDRMEFLVSASIVQFKEIVDRRESELRSLRHETRGSMFIDRIPLANDAVILVYWSQPSWEGAYRFDTFFRVEATKAAFRYSSLVDLHLKERAVNQCMLLSEILRPIPPDDIPETVGFVLDGAIIVDNDLNDESWSMSVRFAGRPDVSFEIDAFVQGEPDEPLRKRMGGGLSRLFAAVGGLRQLRNRERPVGPIWAEEVLVAGTEQGKRVYSFSWEAPGKGNSLAEPNIAVALGVLESAYPTNAESFASDEEALALWDAIIDSIRLRPGAV